MASEYKNTIMQPNSGNSSFPVITAFVIFFSALAQITYGQKLQISDSGYFEKPGLNVLVFSSQYNGMFYDEKTAGIEIIHHGVRTVTGGAVRLQNTPEQWDLIPKLISRKIDRDRQ